MKLKHNKKRNTAFLYEALIRELTKSVVKENNEKKRVVVSLIKEYFSKNSILSEELDLYKSLYPDDKLARPIATKLLKEVKSKHGLLNKKKIFESQSRLINAINRKLKKDVYTNFIPNYKNIATIYQILNPNNTNMKTKVLLEEEYLNNMTTEQPAEIATMKPVDKLTFNTFVNKFNEVYSSSLLKEQNDLLKHYVASFSDNGLELKIYLNEEIDRLKGDIRQTIQNEKFKNNKEVVEKTKTVSV